MPKKKHYIKIPNHSQKMARMLIDQQMWCWGCDVRRTKGNLLALYGAEKRPSPNPRYHSAYVFQLEDNEAVINLWGWGVWIASPTSGSLLIARSRFNVNYIQEFIPMPDAWRKRDLPLPDLKPDNDDLANAYDLLTTALNWIGTYEHWVNTQVTSDYREQNLTSWPQRKQHKGGIPAAEMAGLWFELSESIVS